MKNLLIGAIVLLVTAIHSPVSVHGQSGEDRQDWGGRMYDPRTKTTTYVQVDPNGTRTVTVKDQNGKILSSEVRKAYELYEPARAEWYDPETKQITTVTQDPASGGLRKKITDREGNVISEQVKHYTIETNKALERLSFYRDEIIGLWSERMYDKYVRNDEETLREAFVKKGVTGKTAISYADSWDSLQMAWLDVVGRFYDYHFEALTNSISAVKTRKSVYTGDLAYIAQGMESWWNVHKRIGDLMDKMVDVMAERAYELDHSHAARVKINEILSKYNAKVLGADTNAEIDKALRERDEATRPLEAKEKEHKERAENLSTKPIRSQLEGLASKRLFSSLSEKNPIPVPKVPSEEPQASSAASEQVEHLAKKIVDDIGTVPEEPAKPEPKKPVKAPEARPKHETLERELSEVTQQLQEAEQAYLEDLRKRKRLGYADDALSDLYRLHQDKRTLQWIESPESEKDRTEKTKKYHAELSERLKKYEKYYKETSQQLKGLDTEGLERAFSSSLENAVNAREMLYQKPGEPPKWSWEVRKDLGKEVVNNLENTFDREVTKMHTIARKLGAEPYDIGEKFIEPIQDELDRSYKEHIKKGEAVSSLEDRMKALRSELQGIE